MGISTPRQAPGPAPLEGADTSEHASLAGSERFDSLEPKVLIAGTARLVDEALDLLEHAKKKDDRRLALSALKEARDGLALLMKAAGMLGNDNAVSVTIDARKQSAAVFGSLPESMLRAIKSGEVSLADVRRAAEMGGQLGVISCASETDDGIDTIDQPALESGVDDEPG